MQIRKSLYDRLKSEYRTMLYDEIKIYPYWGARIVKALKDNYYVIDTPWGAITDLQKVAKMSLINPYELFEDED